MSVPNIYSHYNQTVLCVFPARELEVACDTFVYLSCKPLAVRFMNTFAIKTKLTALIPCLRSDLTPMYSACVKIISLFQVEIEGEIR